MEFNRDDDKVTNTVPAGTAVLALCAVVNNNNGSGNSGESSKSQISPIVNDKTMPQSSSTNMMIHSEPAKEWTKLNFEGVDPKSFVGLECKVFWPDDIEWYYGQVVKYDSKTKKHQVDYDDGDVEKLILSEERIRFLVPPKKN